jgi:hypothetical protein
MMEEPDLEQRRRDLQGIERMAADDDVARLMMLFPFRVIGSPLRADSRWRDADPTPSAGVGLAACPAQHA